MYAWEPSFEKQVLEIREKEIATLKSTAYLNASTSFLWSCAPFLVSFYKNSPIGTNNFFRRLTKIEKDKPFKVAARKIYNKLMKYFQSQGFLSYLRYLCVIQ